MLFSRYLIAAAFTASVSASPIVRRVDESLVPQFGVTPGQNPTGTGDCDGIQGKKIPCTCPPDRASFIQSLNANVANGGKVVNNPAVPISFPTGNTKEDKLARLNAATVTLQNLNGPGKGCPQAATTFGAQQAAIQAGTDGQGAGAGAAAPPAPPAAAPAAPAAPANNAPPAAGAPAPGAPREGAGGVDPALVPEFGVKAGQNPTGTGDCDGVNGVKIPCTCPPDRNQFIASMNANLANGGKVVNNPAVPISFPTGQSKADQLARLNAATVTLQNLNGPGKGCPQAATTFGAQQKAIQGN